MSEQKRVNRPYVQIGELKLKPCQFLSVMEDRPAALSLRDGSSILVWRTADEFFSLRLECSPVEALASWRKKDVLSAGAVITASGGSTAQLQLQLQ